MAFCLVLRLRTRVLQLVASSVLPRLRLLRYQTPRTGRFRIYRPFQLIPRTLRTALRLVYFTTAFVRDLRCLDFARSLRLHRDSTQRSPQFVWTLRVTFTTHRVTCVIRCVCVGYVYIYYPRLRLRWITHGSPVTFAFDSHGHHRFTAFPVPGWFVCTFPCDLRSALPHYTTTRFVWLRCAFVLLGSAVYVWFTHVPVCRCR